MLDYHGVIFGGEAWRCCPSFETVFSRQHFASLPVQKKKKRNCEIAPLRVTLGKVTRHYEPEAAKLDWSCCYFSAPSTIHKNLPIRMADNLLDVGPPTAKRPKLNSPLSGSDGPGKNRTFFFCLYKHNSLIKRMCKLATICMSVESAQLHSPAQCMHL